MRQTTSATLIALLCIVNADVASAQWSRYSNDPANTTEDSLLTDVSVDYARRASTLNYAERQMRYLDYDGQDAARAEENRQWAIDKAAVGQTELTRITNSPNDYPDATAHQQAIDAAKQTVTSWTKAADDERINAEAYRRAAANARDESRALADQRRSLESDLDGSLTEWKSAIDEMNGLGQPLDWLKGNIPDHNGDIMRTASETQQELDYRHRTTEDQTGVTDCTKLVLDLLMWRWLMGNNKSSFEQMESLIKAEEWVDQWAGLENESPFCVDITQSSLDVARAQAESFTHDTIMQKEAYREIGLDYARKGCEEYVPPTLGEDEDTSTENPPLESGSEEEFAG